jgi:hypothetical protein
VKNGVTRDGIERTVQQLRESRAQQGMPPLRESDLRARVERAVGRQDHINNRPSQG